MTYKHIRHQLYKAKIISVGKRENFQRYNRKTPQNRSAPQNLSQFTLSHVHKNWQTYLNRLQGLLQSVPLNSKFKKKYSLILD